MRKFIITFALILTPFLPLVGIGAATAAHAERITEEDPRFDCLTMGDRLCGLDGRAEVERRAAEATSDTQRCVLVERVNIASFVALGMECTPMAPTVHVPPAMEQEQSAKPTAPAPIKAKPNFTG